MAKRQRKQTKKKDEDLVNFGGVISLTPSGTILQRTELATVLEFNLHTAGMIVALHNTTCPACNNPGVFFVCAECSSCKVAFTSFRCLRAYITVNPEGGAAFDKDASLCDACIAQAERKQAEMAQFSFFGNRMN